MFATAVSAAIAAFASEVPGTDRRWLWLPLVPLAVWLASLGQGCLADYAAMGGAAFDLQAGWLPRAGDSRRASCRRPSSSSWCVRGAPVMPRVTLALAALAVGALVNLGVMLFHVGDVSIMVLVWHGGTMALLAAVLALAGPRLFGWRHAARAGG